MSSLRRTAVVSLGILFAYYEVYRWIPLGKWNWAFAFPVDNDQFYPDLVIGALLLWFCWSFWRAKMLGMWVGAVLLSLWFCWSFWRAKMLGMWVGAVLLSLWVVVHCLDWWVSYARSLPANAGRFSYYQAHTQILPVIGNHYPPDAGHTVLDFILFPTCLLAIAAVVRNRGRRNETA
jgi:hypothetical protein